MPQPQTMQDLLTALQARFADRLSTNPSVLDLHGRGEAQHPTQPPDAVVFVESVKDVQDLARLCNEAGVALIPYGAGTSLEGHLAALQGGVSVDFSRMNKIVEVHAEDMDVVVEPGVTRLQLDAHLRDTGLFFPIDPGADATIGGMIATRASGTAAVRYGTMKDNVLALDVVMADGRLIKTANRARKSSAGYDLTRLFVGSEGTLGLVVGATLKLSGVPEAMSSAVCPFPTIEAAVDSVIATIQVGVPVARIELMDTLAMTAVNAFSKLDYVEGPTLFYEFHGSEASVQEQAETARAIAAEFGAGDFRWATRTDDRNALWRARHDAYYAALALRPGAKGMSTDTCVPISNLSESIRRTHQLLKESELTGLILGHVGDGNFHALIMFDPNRPEQLAEAERLNAEIVKIALSLDGTCTGEHGIGYGKIKYLNEELGQGATDVMRAIKLALDPNGIMNPGKVLPGN